MADSKVLARDIMDADPPFCSMGDSIETVARRFVDEDLTGMLVVDEDRCLVGVITESDLIDQQKNLHLPTVITLFDMVIPMGESQFEEELAKMQAMTVGDLMQDEVQSVNADSELSSIASIMGDKRIHHLPVMENGSVVGLISKHDVVKALIIPD